MRRYRYRDVRFADNSMEYRYIGDDLLAIWQDLWHARERIYKAIPKLEKLGDKKKAAYLKQNFRKVEELANYLNDFGKQYYEYYHGDIDLPTLFK